MIDWQPIETAPKKTPILMCLRAPAFQQAVGPSVDCQVVVGDMWGDEPFVSGPNGEMVEATHWMPLPEPPGV